MLVGEPVAVLRILNNSVTASVDGQVAMTVGGNRAISPVRSVRFALLSNSSVIGFPLVPLP